MIKTILGFFIIFFIFGFLYINNVITISFLENNHFSLITINSIFVGFLFTSLSLILGLGTSDTTKFLEAINELDKIYYRLITGITCSIISIILALINLCLVNKYTDILTFFEFYFLIMAILFFIFSLKDVTFIIKIIRNEVKEDFQKKD